MSKLNHNPLGIGANKPDKRNLHAQKDDLPTKEDALAQVRQELPSEKDNQVNQKEETKNE